jgi:hypothetical protein
MVQVVEHLPSKHDAPNSIPSIAKKEQEKILLSNYYVLQIYFNTWKNQT